MFFYATVHTITATNCKEYCCSCCGRLQTRKEEHFMAHRQSVSDGKSWKIYGIFSQRHSRFLKWRNAAKLNIEFSNLQSFSSTFTHWCGKTYEVIDWGIKWQPSLTSVFILCLRVCRWSCIGWCASSTWGLRVAKSPVLLTRMSSEIGVCMSKSDRLYCKTFPQWISSTSLSR